MFNFRASPFALGVPALLIAALTTACAQGGGIGDDAGVSVDAGPSIDSATAPIDAGSPMDAGPVGDDAGPMMDAGVDAGPTGPVVCTPSTAATVCGGRPCVDGYCCDAPCSGLCQDCGLAGTEGICVTHTAGTDPADECDPDTGSTCGRTGECDGAGGCAFGRAGLNCDDAMTCTTADVCDGMGACAGMAPSTCGPGVGNECCVGTCTDTDGCTTVAGDCADTCGSAELTIGGSCTGCGAAGAVGLCTGRGTHRCDETSHSLCQELTCGGVAYYCTSRDGSWAWRPTAACNDLNACTHTDVCGSGMCTGTTIDCSSTTCATRACNGSPVCSVTPRSGSCDDGDACTYNDMCDGSGACGAGSRISCDDTPCIDRECNGTFTCTEMILTGSTCDDGMACTYGSTCTAGGACMGGTTVDCDAMDTTCSDFSCDGTAACASTPRAVGMMCDDGNAATLSDQCQADGTCAGTTCSPTPTVAFSDDFASPSSSSWSNGTDVAVNTSRWNAFTTARHGVRINGGRLEITNVRSSSASHGQGYAYVRTGGTGSDYDNTVYDSTLKNNTGDQVVWTLNMHRDDPDSTDGGFSCSSSSSQNGRTVGLAYVLASNSASGLNADAGTCSASATAFGYAVVFGGGGRNVRLVRFVNGLRNGTLTDIVASGSESVRSYFSVRVTYNAVTDQWRLESRSDGTSSFSDPASGSYGFTGTGTDATYVTMPLEYAGPYFQTGCTGLCNETYTTRFDNVRVGVGCAP